MLGVALIGGGTSNEPASHSGAGADRCCCYFCGSHWLECTLNLIIYSAAQITLR